MKRLCFFVFLLLIVSVNVFALNITFIDSSAQNITFNYTPFDTPVGSYVIGSDSYSNIENERAFDVVVCDYNESANTEYTVGYFSESRNLTGQLTHFNMSSTGFSEVIVDNVSFNCTTIPFDLATIKSVYPGFVSLLIYDQEIATIQLNGSNSSNTTVINYTTLVSNETIFFDGRYELDVSVNVLFGKTYEIRPSRIFDQENNSILRTAPYLLMSLVDTNGSSKAEIKTDNRGFLPFSEDFQGGEFVYVNGLPSLEIKVFNPCEDEINETGYYIMNSTIDNANRTCITIDNLTNTVINFAGGEISGDNNLSVVEDTCPVIIRNSENITIENLRVNQFYNGLCVDNSTGVTVLGNGSTFNVNGAFITNNSNVLFSGIAFEGNNVSELLVQNNSFVEFQSVFFTGNIDSQRTRLAATFVDAKVSSVPVIPPLPTGFEEINDIDQYIQFTNTSANRTWAQINFEYTSPLPDGVVADNISIFKFNGTYLNITNSTFNNITNITTNTTIEDWVNGQWLELPTLINTSAQTIIGPNVTEFSVFAPFGFETEPEEVPTPEPQPNPEPSSGGGGGGGSAPAIATEETDFNPFEVEIELSLPELVTLQQGEVGEIEFNVTNIGLIPADGIYVAPAPLSEWEIGNSSSISLAINETESETFLLGPYESIVPRTYSIRINAYSEDGVILAAEFLNVRIIPKENVKRVRVIEFPPVVKTEPFTRSEVSFFMKNVGTRDLEGLEIEFEDSTCLESINGVHDLVIDESGILTFEFLSKQTGNCDVTLNFYDAEGDLVGFVPITIINEYEDEEDVQRKKYILLLILTATTTLTSWIILRKH